MNQKTPASYLHASNVLTYASLLAGLLAVDMAREAGGWNLCGALIALCAFLDTFDGRWARRFPRNRDEAAFGVELDSLSDAVVFGFVPVICILLLLDVEASAVSRVAVGVAAMAWLTGALTRLGCYNLHQKRNKYFRGLPTTLAALLLSALFLAHPPAWVAAAALALGALAMVAPLPVPRPVGWGMAAFVSSIALIFALHMIPVLS